MKRLFTAKQKRHLYITAGGKCVKCGAILAAGWEAHHTARFVDGGVTELTNGMALCRACHKSMHRGKRMFNIKPRGWQEKALKNFINHDHYTDGAFLLEACPGSGKTIYSALAAKQMIDDGEVNFVLVVVPTTALKGDAHAGFLGDWNKVGVDLTTTMKSNAEAPPSGFHGGVVTYAQLTNLVGIIETWKSFGIKLMVVFDEVHHASEDNTWGSAAERVGECSSIILAMTGTPFRGDSRKISFVTYRNDMAVANEKYTYREAVSQNVCREVFFAHDNGVAEYVEDDKKKEVRISDADPFNAGKVAAVAFHHESTFLKAIIEKADAKIDEYEQEGRGHTPAGIIICRPGADDNDDKHLLQVAKRVKRITGEMPVVITHDDPDANAKIDSFRNGSTRWICSVRKISEGVDIKRLRVQVMASVPGTELLFRQLVGRVVRVIDNNNPEDATVFMGRFPQLEEWAKRIEDEAKKGLKERPKPKDPETDPADPQNSMFMPLDSTHEHDGGIALGGEQFNSVEIDMAERLKSGDPALTDTSIPIIAHLLRKVGFKPEPDDDIQEPLHVTKKKLRDKIVKVSRRVAIYRNPDTPNFQSVFCEVNKRFRIKGMDDLMDNHSIEKMQQIYEYLCSYSEVAK